MVAFFILAGEASGDLHGAHLVQALREQGDEVTLFGVAGPRMRESGVMPLLRSEDFQIMGFAGVIAALPRLRRQLNTCADAILEKQPDGVILIDYAGFNMKLAKTLRQRGYQGKIVQYISPKVWAWRAGRIQQLAKTLDLLLVIFPFETNCYKESGLRTEYVGNPLTEYLADFQPNDTLAGEGRLIAILPGSRRSEIKLNLQRQLDTAKALKQRYPDLRFGLSVANDAVAPLIDTHEIPNWIDLVPARHSYELMYHAHAALATSGTVNLELALHSVPTVVVYRLSWINAALAALVFRIRLPFYCMVNIVAGKQVYPELIHHHFTVKRATQELAALIDEGEARATCLAGCEEVKELLAKEKPSSRAAELILSLVQNPAS